MNTRNSFDQTNSLFYTKYNSSNKDSTFRGRFRSFQTTAIGNEEKMEQIEQMFNNYNLFKYGKCITNAQRRTSLRNIGKESPEASKHKNNKERLKESQNLKKRLEGMKNQRKDLFEKVKNIKAVKPTKN